MKRFLPILFFVSLIAISNAFAEGTVQQEVISDDPSLKRLVFNCTGDAYDGSIPNTAISPENLELIKGFYIRRVSIENTSSQTDVTDDSDVYFRLNYSDGSYNANGDDYIGGQGVDQLDQDTTNFIRITNVEAITGPGASLVVANQDTASAQWTITFILVK